MKPAVQPKDAYVSFPVPAVAPLLWGGAPLALNGQTVAGVRGKQRAAAFNLMKTPLIAPTLA